MNNAETSNELAGFKDEIQDIQIAISDFESGKKLNVAVIAEPFAGITTLLNELEKMNPIKVTRLSFSTVVKNKDEILMLLSEQSKRIIIIDHCEFLYTRKIGGFDVLEDFLKLVVSSSNLFITTWNLYSWKYLDEVLNIGKFFPIQINVQKFTTSEIKECILSGYKPDEIKFTEDVEFEKENLVDFVKFSFQIKPLKKIINIPFFKINYHIFKVWLFKKKVTTEDIIFEKINYLSKGNPGVAQVLWQKSLEYPTIKPSKIKELDMNVDLDYNDSFILGVILSMKSIKKEELAEITGPEYQIDEILFGLLKWGLISIDDGYCSIKPEALGSIVEFLKKLRMVW